jgi:flagellar motor switch protein FliN
MKSLKKAIEDIAVETGGSISDVDVTWAPEASDTVISAVIEGADMELVLSLDAKAIESLGGQDAALNKAASWLDMHGATIASEAGGRLSEEANMGFTRAFALGHKCSFNNGSVVFGVTGIQAPSSTPAQSQTKPKVLPGIDLGLLGDVPLLVTAELGRTTMHMRELLSLAPGSIVELDRLAGSPIDVLVNGKTVARGEVVVVDEEFGIRIVEIVDPEQR